LTAVESSAQPGPARLRVGGPDGIEEDVVTLDVGVIGVGMIGQEHIRRLHGGPGGSRVVAVADADTDRAAAVAGGLPEAKALPTGEELVASDAVDAVVVTSWGPTHEPYVLAAVAAGKPVFCEKPLATTQEACLRILEAEMAFGRRLVQVGYMRRYDPAYRALKETVASGAIGAPLLVHCVHRNPDVPPHYTSDMAINDTAVHDVDTVRWLLDDEVVATHVLVPRRNSRAGELRDPLLVLLEMAGGAIADVEVSVNIGYGYDIRGEISGETGTASLGESNPVVVKREGSFSGRVPADWRERFLRAFDVEFQEWLGAAAKGTATGPSAWDGYAATAVCDAALEALRTGTRTKVSLRERPEFYR
jgi:myo-inositol 2-dehydrogenase / D-chiro-inositol 1-dehydrogenase